MHDENTPETQDTGLPDDIRRAVDLVREAPLPEEARGRARELALKMDEPAKTLPVRRRGRRLLFALASVAAALIVSVAAWSYHDSGTIIPILQMMPDWPREEQETFVFHEQQAKPTYGYKRTPTSRPGLEAYYQRNVDRSEEITAARSPTPDPVSVLTVVGGKPGEGQPGQQPGPLPVVNPGNPDDKPHNTEDYARIVDNAYRAAARDPLSTFSVDVDTASYSNLRRFLNDGQLPPKDAVRIEEMINYFSYDYPDPKGDHPVSINTELTDCPWRPAHRLLRIGLQGKRIDPKQLPARNLVFLIDVSGSMNESNKLPLVKESMKLLVEQLDKNDRVAIVVYAGSSGLVLPATPGDQRGTIVDALERLQAGGSTNGGAGIQLAYKIAQENFIKEGVNRVILATDGDFNVGVSSQGELLRLIEGKRQSGVFLTILGFGMGNLKDSTMEKLADHGNGHYAYIDTLAEARKVFVEEGAALVTIAKDVKLQLEFNPKHVQAYRLIGYENRLLKKEDFNDDKKDAGDIGSGHRVTALYEIVPAGIEFKIPGVDDLKYQKPLVPSKESDSDEALTVKLRYKEPTAETSQLLTHTVAKKVGKLDEASADQRWAAAVAALGMLLRDSPYKGDITFTMIRELAEKARGEDKPGHKAEFLKLIEAARALKQPTSDAK